MRPTRTQQFANCMSFLIGTQQFACGFAAGLQCQMSLDWDPKRNNRRLIDASSHRPPQVVELTTEIPINALPS
jgi:hypothetical protein